jgi:hypothetical protein
MRSNSGSGAIEYLPPREDVNSPDMYIPVMAFVTYILLSTLIAGLNGKFEPQLLGITFTNASFIILLELIVLWGGRYFLNISSESQIYDLIAYSGYKFVGVIVTIALAAIVNRGAGTGGWFGWALFLYTFLANAFFLVSDMLNERIVGERDTDDRSKTASLSQICAPATRQRPSGSCPTITADTVPLRLQLCSAIRVHDVAEHVGSQPFEEGRQIRVLGELRK